MANIKIPIILITGRNGQVGWELERSLQPLGKVIALDRQGMDLANPDSIRRAIRDIKPNLIVNAAAYTAVDKAESEPELAMAINGVAPGIMAEEAKRFGSAIVHYSTDYIFDGTKAEPYIEEDEPNPLSVYGTSKLAGERAIQAIGIPHIIFRTSWVYGARGRNFLLTVLRLASERTELRMVDDQVGAPTWCRTIAEATAAVIVRAIRDTKVDVEYFNQGCGVYNLSPSGYTSWCGFAGAIMQAAPRKLKRPVTVMPIKTADYPLPARRPANSRFETDKLTKSFQLFMPDWQAALTLCVAQMEQT